MLNQREWGLSDSSLCVNISLCVCVCVLERLVMVMTLCVGRRLVGARAEHTLRALR